jgi:hypothetical protein
MFVNENGNNQLSSPLEGISIRGQIENPKWAISA